MISTPNYGPIILLTTMWFIYVIPALLLAGVAIFLSPKKISFRRIDILPFIVPFIVMLAVEALGNRSKTFSNAIFEPPLLGIIVGIGFIAVVLLSKRYTVQKMRLPFLALSCLAAILVWALIPPLPE